MAGPSWRATRYRPVAWSSSPRVPEPSQLMLAGRNLWCQGVGNQASPHRQMRNATTLATDRSCSAAGHSATVAIYGGRWEQVRNLGAGGRGLTVVVRDPTVGGREILPVGGHEPPRWRPWNSVLDRISCSRSRRSGQLRSRSTLLEQCESSILPRVLTVEIAVELVNHLNEADKVPVELVQVLCRDPVLLMDVAPDRLHIISSDV